jgi:hypothetical protein
MRNYFNYLKTTRIQAGMSILLCFACNAGFGQSEMLNSLKKGFDQYRRQNLQEKLFVHMDKSFYVAGEIMWFKIYDVDGTFNKPLDLSKIAYVEVIDRDQKPVMQAKISLDLGKGSGSFFVPLTVKSGNYKFRAYTNWMKNFSPDYFFEKNITVINSLKKLSDKPTSEAGTYNIQFFPEGGNLVSGIESVIGFKVTDNSGKGIDDFRGSIIDQNNNSVVLFGAHKFGMGHFTFKPAEGSRYSAVIKVGNNNAVVSEFPSASTLGYVMRVEELGKDSLHITVNTNINAPGQPVYLFAHTRQVVKVSESKVIDNGSAEFVVNKNSLGEGISSFTLFNFNLQPVAERLYFRHPNHLVIEAIADRNEYATRKKINIALRTKDGSGKGEKSDLSVSVYMVDSLQMIQQSNILSYLWLTSDIRGYIESPDYYFNNPEEDVAESVDNLMLTQGWRRFRWEDIVQNKAPVVEFMPEYEGHIINGRIIFRKTGLPAENVTTYLSAPGQKFQLGTALSNKNGLIQFDIRNLFGSNEIVLQSANQKDTTYRMEIFTPFSEKFSDVPIPRFALSETLQQDLLYHSVGMQVQNAFLTDYLQKFDAPWLVDSTAFYGQPDRKYFLDDYTRFNSMEEVMREYVSFVSVHRRKQKFYFKVLNSQHKIFFDEEPLMLLDGVVVTDADKLMAYDPLKVKKIEVVGREYYLGSAIASGIISYTTYKGDLDGFQIDPNSVVLEYDGLQLQREFYSPVYETDKQISSRMPDFRNLLYWSPDVSTDADGAHRLSFYSSDRQGKYLVVVQGITASGKAGSHLFTFEVNKP